MPRATPAAALRNRMMRRITALAVPASPLGAYLVAQMIGLSFLDAAKALLLLKDVDGIFARDPKRDPAAPLLSRVPRSRLARYRCVDRQFATWIRAIGSCWIVNGTKPARVREWLQGGETLGTRVVVG